MSAGYASCLTDKSSAHLARVTRLRLVFGNTVIRRRRLVKWPHETCPMKRVAPYFHP